MKYHFTFYSMYRESKKIAQDGKWQSGFQAQGAGSTFAM